MVSDVVGKLESDSLVSQDIQDVEELERGLLGIGYERQCCGRYPDRFPYSEFKNFGLTTSIWSFSEIFRIIFGLKFRSLSQSFERTV